ncbi:MAG: hypothetical protein M1821_003522 [Bathelium mastoideum]|nr:MAG: hypothetical protein M1821_003522 [Bathelium mastoideum]
MESDTAVERNGPEMSKEAAAAPKRQLGLSRRIGRPPYVLDPDDLGHCQNYAPRVVRADKETVVKFGRNVRLAEAEALHLVAQKTSIAVPKLIGAYVLDGVTYIIMSYEEGRPFGEVWEAGSPDVRENLIQQLKDYVQQMRQIKGDFVGGVDYSACRAGLFEWDAVGYEREYGPFKDEAGFNDGIVAALDNRFPPHPSKKDISEVHSEWELRRLVRSLINHEIVFTHGDLHTGNMIVRADGTIVLLDWETAGYWPDYWEFHRARFHGGPDDEYRRTVEQFIPPSYVEDFVMHHILQKMIGSY